MFTKLIEKNWILYAVIVLFLHIIGVCFLLMAASRHPFLPGLAFLAYMLGLRHAFDADHIAAIDNTVRKLVQQKENPVGTGFYFSIGHSSVVFIMVAVLSISVNWAKAAWPHWQETGSIIGTVVSGCFLLFIGILNLFILFDLQKMFLSMRSTAFSGSEIEGLLMKRGFAARFAGPLYRFIRKSWHIYPLGFLFGLGFDTASEVALLAISAGAAGKSISILGILSLPLLFAAGMSLMDTADGVFMTQAYHWAFSTPLRKVYYNLTVTGLSVMAALLIGIMELAQVISKRLGLTGWMWQKLQGFDMTWMGYLLVVLFLLAWGTSFAIWKVFHIEERWNQSILKK